MPGRRSVEMPTLPLLTWPQARVIARLEDQRAALAARIEQLPPHAHYRLELEARLRELTARQMRLEIELRATR